MWEKILEAHILLFKFGVCVYVCVCVYVDEQEKSHIEVHWRPLSQSASTLVFLSRRTDMPYLYHTSLAKLNYEAGNYEVYTPFASYPVYLTLY